MQTVAIIPARSGSKGLENKNMYPILEKPLIQWSFEQMKETKELDNIFVTTDDSKVMDLARAFDINIIKRPKNLSSDTSTSESALIHALNEIKNNYLISPDIIVFLQATSPLRKIDDIKNAIQFFIDKNADSLFSATVISDLTIWNNTKDNWESLNFDYQNRKRRQDMPLNFIENGSIYIFKPEILINHGNRLGGKIVSYLMEFWQTWEIDTKDEVDLVEYYLKNKKINQYY